MLPSLLLKPWFRFFVLVVLSALAFDYIVQRMHPVNNWFLALYLLGLLVGVSLHVLEAHLDLPRKDDL